MIDKIFFLPSYITHYELEVHVNSSVGHHLIHSKYILIVEITILCASMPE